MRSMFRLKISAPLGVNFIGKQEAPAIEPSGDLRAFPAGGSAQVTDPLPRLWVQQGHRGHSAGFL